MKGGNRCDYPQKTEDFPKTKNQERQLTEAAQMLLRVYLKLVELKFEGIQGDPRGYRAENLKMNQTWFLKSQAGRMIITMVLKT